MKDGERAILGEPEPHAELVPDGPSEDPLEEDWRPYFGTRAQGDSRISQLAKEEPFKGTATTKGFVNAIKEVVTSPEVTKEEEWLNEQLEAIFQYVSSPQLVRLGPIAAAWVFNVPEDEVDAYLSQMPNAKSLGGGWWEITVDERLKPVSS